MKKAFVTGITGQDGSYLAELLMGKGYEVHGLKRRSSVGNTARIDKLIGDPSLVLHEGDLTDSSNLNHLVGVIQPDEIYNLGAQSDVKTSWSLPEFTAQVDALGTLHLLEAIRLNGLENRTRMYQASTSELFGLVSEPVQSEKTPFYPRSPYAVAKLYSYWIAVNYRESYGMFTSNGILFNHESPRRGENFVTRKITMAAARIALGLQDRVSLGNLNSKRDWGHAKDYVEGMWRMLQTDRPDDFVLATGQTTSIRDFASMAFSELGIEIAWHGDGISEQGINTRTNKVVVDVDPRYFRPSEVGYLLGDAEKARRILGWKPTYDVRSLCSEMVAADLEIAKKDIAL